MLSIIFHTTTAAIGKWRCIYGLLLCLAIVNFGWSDSLYEVPANTVGQQTLEEFVVGNFEFILLHELAHLIVGENKVPILGPEENAADYIAATFLLRGDGQDAAARQRLRKYVESAANAFAVLWEHERSVGTQIPYWGSHALGVQRYFRLMCLLAGSNPGFVRSSPLFDGVAADRAEDCDVEYEKADRSVQWLLDNYGRGPDAPAGEPVKIVYEDTSTHMQTKLMAEIRDRQIVELTVEALTERFVLTRPLRIVMRTCQRPAAMWNPEQGVLTLCYDLLDAFRLIYKIGRRAA